MTSTVAITLDFISLLMQCRTPTNTGKPILPTCQEPSDISIWLADNINTQYKQLLAPGTGNATVTTTLLQVMLGFWQDGFINRHASATPAERAYCLVLRCHCVIRGWHVIYQTNPRSTLLLTVRFLLCVCVAQRVAQCNYSSLVTYVGSTDLEQQLADAANQGKLCDALPQ